MRQKFHFPTKLYKYSFVKQDKEWFKEKNHCTRMACPLVRFKPGGKCMGHYANVKKCDTVEQLKSSIMEGI